MGEDGGNLPSLLEMLLAEWGAQDPHPSDVLPGRGCGYPLIPWGAPAWVGGVGTPQCPGVLLAGGRWERFDVASAPLPLQNALPAGLALVWRSLASVGAVTTRGRATHGWAKQDVLSLPPCQVNPLPPKKEAITKRL